MYMPGRIRTCSRPSRTWMSSPVYSRFAVLPPMSVHSVPAGRVRQRLDRHRWLHQHQLTALDHLAALAAAPADLLLQRLELEPLVAAGGLDHELVALAAGDETDTH